MYHLKTRVFSMLLVVCFVLTFVASETTAIYAETESTIYSGETFLAMDEDGNLTYIPLEDVETLSTEEIDAMDNISYEVVLEINDDAVVLSTHDTETQAQEQVQQVQTILETEDTTGKAMEEIAVVTESQPELETYYDLDTSIDTASTDSNLFTQALAVASSMLTLSNTTTATTTDTDSSSVTVYTTVTATDVTYGVLIFSDYVEYLTEDGYTTYTHGSYAPDAAYLGLSSDGKYIFKQSGATGYVTDADASVIEYDTFIAEGNIVSCYTTSNGKLYHKITTDNKSYQSTQMVGYQQDYMTSGATYYSYDGIYFYTSYKTMITDYKNDTYKNAINASEPYYNYYQYLSQRSTTNFTAAQLDEYIASKASSSSMLIGTGQDFIDNQNLYGVNAALMLGVAINESGWGTSSFATERNNLFGHGASDNNVFNAYTYDSISDGIAYHADSFMSQGYLNPKNWKYYGSNLGNKASGANVKYASDPYWGEKAAASVYAIEEYFSDQVYDYDSYQIGVTNSKVYAYAELGGTSVYNSISGGNTIVENMPVLVLAEVTYEGETWYKIQSDAVLTDDRTAVNTSSGLYDFDRDYVYVKASDVTLVNSADIEYEELYTLGDPSGDNIISAIDYMMIKNHIMGTSTLTGTAWSAADVNKDSNISAIDYMMIKNHIMGTSTIS